ncbi:MAG: ribosome biogenesis GTPase Der [Bacteroidota bacterium]
MTERTHGDRPLVAIVGRPNVGKSTLFNRLAKERIAIVESVPGVTRDRLYAPANWNGREFLLVDTGGITDSRDSLDKQVSDQALLAAAEADLVLFLVDARDGLLPMDKEIGGLLRRVGKPVLLVANKAESMPAPEAEFYPLGLGEPMPLSAEHGLRVGDLLDQIVALLPPAGTNPEPAGIAVAVVGRPNVGKSSLVNALLGDKRVITGDRPGTTRDAIDTKLSYEGNELTLIDTAGIRRSARVEERIEYYSVLRALKAIERCDVTLLVLEAGDPATIQDQHIAGIAHDAGKACLILVNKWDLVAKEEKDTRVFKDRIRTAMEFMDYAPIEFISARTGYGMKHVLPLIISAAAEHARRIPTSRLNEVLNEAVLMHEPPSYKGRKLRLYYASQVRAKPPLIAIQVNDPDLVHFSYRRYLENRFREAFGLSGTPLWLNFKPRLRH